MNKFDLIFLSILTASAVMGVVRGVTKEILSLLSWVGAVAMAYFLFPTTQYLARSKISNPWLADGVTMFAIFIIFLIVLTLISHFLTSRVRASALSGVDRSLGIAYGLLRGCALLFIFELVISCAWLRPDHPELIKQSRFVNFMYKGSDTLYVILPKEAQDWIRSLQEKRLSERKPPSIEDIKQAGQIVANVGEQVAPVVQAAIDRANEKQVSAEDLANLKPKEAPENKAIRKTNTKKQDIEMDRLLDQANAE
ncbi:MAG: CvpA family protein [Proteobacteria bacterium]|nr:CvpA family protein [Pseudomonadota bacterium]